MPWMQLRQAHMTLFFCYHGALSTLNVKSTFVEKAKGSEHVLEIMQYKTPQCFFLSNLSILYWIYLKDIQLTKYL